MIRRISIAVFAAVGFVPLHARAGEASIVFCAGWDQDLSKGMPWQEALLPKEKITPEIIRAMDMFSNSYPHDFRNPDGKGVDENRFRAIVGRVSKALPFDLEKPGPRRGVAIDTSDPKARKPGAPPPMSFEGEWFPMLKEVVDCYAHAKPEQEAPIRDAFRRLAQSLIAAGFDYRHSWKGWFGNGYAWRRWGGYLPLMAHTLPPREKSLYLDAIFNASEGCALYAETPAGNTDVEYNYYPTAFGFIGRMDNGPVKWQRLRAIRRGLDLEVLRGRLTTPDGGILHHTGHHVSYAGYSLNSLFSHQIRMAKAGIIGPHTKDACLRYRKIVSAWAFNSMRAEIPPPLQLRPAPVWETDRAKGQNPGSTPGFARSAADLTSFVFATPVADDSEMARLVCSKAAGNKKVVPADWQRFMDFPGFCKPLHGHWCFPVMGASIHRRDDWMAIVRGANNFFRGGEVYADAGYPGAYMDHIMHGALFIISRGDDGRFPNCADSGLRAEGFDPNMFPNVTAAMMDNPSLAGRGRPDYMGGDGAKQGGSVSLDANAVWSWLPATGLRKSAFFFGNRITLITANISLPGKDVRTTLFQHTRDAGSHEKLVVDGRPAPEKTEADLPGPRSHMILDANRTGYYLPAGNPDLVFKRGEQGYTYALPSRLKKGADKKILGEIARRPGLAKHIGQFDPIVRPVSLAYFRHGENPKKQACAYHVLVRTTPENLEAFKRSIEDADPENDPCKVVIGESFHYLFDRATSTHAAATFAAAVALPMPEVKKINRPCTVMSRRANDGRLRIAIGSTDLSDKSPFVVALDGAWHLIGGDTPRGWTRFDGTRTTLTLTYLDQTARLATLEPIPEAVR